MEKKINFVSIVAFGNFNPAIITADFINDECELNLGELSGRSPENPVIKQLKFKNIDIDVFLERCQIREHGPESIKKVKILDIFNNIYNKLKYTPMSIVGVNINYDIAFSEKNNELIFKLESPKTILGFFRSDKTLVQKKYLYTEKEEKWHEVQYRLENIKGLTRSVNVINKLSLCTINYNCETIHLSKNKNELDLIISGYDSFCDEFNKFLKHIEG
jgi:hypothetical protein